MMPRVVEVRAVPDGPDRLPRDLHPVARRVLLARGVHDAAELGLDLRFLQPPGSLGGLEEAAREVAGAVTGRRRILVVGDFDADGATGSALAVLALREMGAAAVDFRVPNRFEFGYGLTVGLVDTLAEQPPDLLITVDSGIACLAGVDRARALGCRVVVTDHHLPGDALPAADAIVNPNLPGDGFPSKALSGVGVMFYLLLAVRRQLRDAGWFGRGVREPNLARYLDLVALGTVADLVPLDRNNRILVRQGLERIRRGLARPGLLALLRLGNRDYRYAEAADLGFAVGPRLNAAGRLEDMGAGIRCLLCEDPDEASALASQLDSLNRQRRDLQEQMQAEAMQQVERLLERLSGSELPPALCLADDAWHQGIVGLVASRIKDQVHRPVVAFAPESGGAARLKGSARSIRGLHIRDALAWVDARHPGLMAAFGGHAMAAGLTLERERLPRFRSALQEAVTALLDGDKLAALTLTDGELGAGDLGLELARLFEDLGPWGQRFPEPLFEGWFEIIEQRIVGGSHLKMVVRPHGGGPAMDAIAFNRLPEQLPAQGPARLLYRLSVNRWRGEESCQLMVEDILP